MSGERTLIACACVLAALAAACHDLPDLGTCGNNVAEEANGEACDQGGDSPTCSATCELRCTSTAVTPAYVSAGTDPTGKEVFCPDARYRCGLDGVCRAPAGSFAQLTAAQPFDVAGSPVLADVDNDGLADLVGTSATNIYVRFSSTRGAPLGDLVVQAAPSSDAPYAIFDLNPGITDSAESDVVIAVPTEGVALLKSDGASFVPQLDLSIPVTGETQGFIVRDPNPALGDVVVVAQRRSMNSSLAVVRVPVGAPGAPPDVPMQLLPPCVGAAGQAWGTVDVKVAADGRSFVVVSRRESLAQPSAQPWHVCRYTHAGLGWALADFELATPTPSSVVLANLDGEPCLELVVRSDAEPDKLSMIDAGGGTCGFAAPVIPVQFAGTGAPLLGAGQVVLGGIDELVLANGVYRACTGADCGASPFGTFVRAVPPTTPVPWSAAAVVDLNGDDALDVVAARVPEADVDIVRGGVVPNAYRANTSEPIGSMVAGDFDGDRLGDVAMVETTMLDDRIVVLFGTQESIVGTPRPMSAFKGKLQLDRVGEIHWIPSTRGSDGIDDLLVVDLDPRRPTPAAGLVVGDAARLMTTPRFPPMPSGASLDAVAAGAFGSPNVEVLAFTNNQVQLFNVNANAWAPPVPVGMTFRQPVAALRAGPVLTRAVARPSGAGTSENDLVVFSVRGMFAMCRTTAAAEPIELRGIDIDGDNIDEVAAFSGGNGAPRAMQMFGASCPLAPVLADELAGCIDVANTGDRLVALCRSTPMGGERGLFEITRVGESFVRAAQPFAELDGDGRFLTAGDYDGDGVLDVAVGVNRGGVVNVQLLRQCPAHDTRACRR